MDTIKDSNTLGHLIRKERKNQCLIQEEPAALAGVGVRFVRELEHRKERCLIGLSIKVI